MFDRKAWHKKYYEEHKEVIIQRAIQWNKEHWDKHLEYSYKSKKDTVNGMSKKEYMHNYYENHKEYYKNYYESHKEELRAYEKDYAKKRRQKKYREMTKCKK